MFPPQNNATSEHLESQIVRSYASVSAGDRNSEILYVIEDEVARQAGRCRLVSPSPSCKISENLGKDQVGIEGLSFPP
jgi:hypothetical protein